MSDVGYGDDLYHALIEYGLAPRMSLLDIGCGTGVASRPLVENGFRVTGVDVSEPLLATARERLPAAKWILGAAQSLPFPDGSFDMAIGAQAFHRFDRTKALAEVGRVLRPRGIVAIWWKSETNDDPVKRLSDEVARELGAEPLRSGLTGGFKEFYAAELTDRALRVVPWKTTISRDEYLSYERSRRIVQKTFGARAEAYVEALAQRLDAQFGIGNPTLPLEYIQFLYLGRTP